VVEARFRTVCHLPQAQAARPPTNLPAPPKCAEPGNPVPFPNATPPVLGRVGLKYQQEGTEQMTWTHLAPSLL
jgi:hypothetical protein